jgi:hypothetical protein
LSSECSCGWRSFWILSNNTQLIGAILKNVSESGTLYILRWRRSDCFERMTMKR